MTPLRRALADYLVMRRALGFKLERAEKLLAQLLGYLEEVGAETLTNEHALAWARLPAGGSVNWWAQRLTVTRGFARYLQAIDVAAEVPPWDLLPTRPRRATPYLYSDEDLAALIAATGGLRFPLRAATYETLIGLLAVSGLRVGEALRLDRDDLDLEHELLVVRGSKFGKSREIPLHESAVQALRGYLKRRDRPQPAPRTPAVFISTTGRRLSHGSVGGTFRQLVRGAGLKPRSACCRPRLHDLRHTFAVRTLIDCYRGGGDAAVRLPLLSTYLGHVDPAATYWYLSAAPELLGLAAGRLEESLGGRS